MVTTIETTTIWHGYNQGNQNHLAWLQPRKPQPFGMVTTKETTTIWYGYNQ
ncbi:hypothetical protein DPMN_092091 [Dreissena polymorpha]|uniref:Uncharacterized protein n=1 Tax=Dreissena polymorpha TaxID=45954 RepID=A0A9D4R0J5_DREPO|nr:hypothetical protein DPMN_092091 [Dreissena polymorpha]